MPVPKKTTKIMQRKQKQTPFKKSMLLTTIGCGAVMSGLGPQAQCSAFSIPSMTVKSFAQNDERLTQAWYRNGDEDDSPEMIRDHEEATSSLRGSGQRWGINSILPKQKKDNIDEYLQFLDRRYNRLHSDERANLSNKQKDTIRSRVNIALKWVLEDRGLNPNHVPKSVQEDALFVLGLAESAGTRLLERRQLPGSTKPQITIVRDIPYEDDISTQLESWKRNQMKAVLAGTKIYRTLHERKATFISCKISTLSRFGSRSTAMLATKVLSILKLQANFMKHRVKALSAMTLSLATLLILQPLQTLPLKNICA